MLDQIEQSILTCLRGDPIFVNKLARLVGCESGDWHGTEPELRGIIRSLRLRGYPICSGSKGYWLGTADECESCGEELRGRASAIFAVGNALRATAGRLRDEDGEPRRGNLF